MMASIGEALTGLREWFAPPPKEPRTFSDLPPSSDLMDRTWMSESWPLSPRMFEQEDVVSRRFPKQSYSDPELKATVDYLHDTHVADLPTVKPGLETDIGAADIHPTTPEELLKFLIDVEMTNVGGRSREEMTRSVKSEMPMEGKVPTPRPRPRRR